MGDAGKKLTWFSGAWLQIVCIVCIGCAMSPHDESAVEALLTGTSPPVFHTITVENRSIHFAEVGNPLNPPVMFIHGTPGSWESFAEYMADENLSEKFHLLAIDRPGFGRSDNQELILSLQRQAELLRPVMFHNRSGFKPILVGHSLGAPVAVRIAMDFPEAVGGLLLVAPSIDPDLESPRWYNRLADCGLIRWAVPDDLMLANDEIMVLQQELEAMLPLWAGVDVPVIVIQGGQDRLVDPENADFAARVLGVKAEVKRVPDAGHFILWNRPALIRDAILSLMNGHS